MGLSNFGNISIGKMILSESGQMAFKLWHELPEHFLFVSLDEFVVMPNHIHGIVIIEPTTAVGTLHATSLQSTKNEFMSAISPKSGSLATVIRSYKSVVSKKVHFIDHDFSWQPRYYDHIIHSNRELYRIRNYIFNNPIKWEYQ
jgi:REP element-mobilizing transposase RayT